MNNYYKKPTPDQLGTLYRWMSWRIPLEKARNAVHWLRDNKSRKEVSFEMQRIKKLYDNHNLDMNSCFSSDIWKEYLNR